MDLEEAIVLAMAAGAASSFRPNPLYRRRPVDQAYHMLQRYLAERYPAVANDILDIGPASAERQTTLGAQLRESGAAADPAVLMAAALRPRLTLEHDPDATTAVFAGVDNLNEAANVLDIQMEKV